MRLAALLLVALLSGALAPPALAADDEVVDEVLAILHERGLVDDDEYARLRHKQERWKSEQSIESRIEWSGDMRARFEQFWFERDPTGVDRSNQSRINYRLRLEGRARINDWVTAVFRIASGQGSARSSNQTLGSGNDFDPDDIFIDQAYLELTSPEGWIPGRSKLRIGKMDVPFRWRHSPDSILWDSDLEVEGVDFSWALPELGGTRPYARAAYLIADENAQSRDPHVLGLQLGFDADLAEDWSAGARVTQYEWGSLDPAFHDRSASFGSQPGGASGFSVTELAGTVAYDGIDDWPLRLYGHVLRNHDASGSGSGDEDMGFGVGLTVGDKRKIAQLGAGWFRMEANAWPGQFVDSPLLAGRVNQEAIALHVLREILTGTDLKMSLFIGEADERGSAFANSLPGSDRVLLQTDLMVRF